MWHHAVFRVAGGSVPRKRQRLADGVTSSRIARRAFFQEQQEARDVSINDVVQSDTEQVSEGPCSHQRRP